VLLESLTLAGLGATQEQGESEVETAEERRTGEEDVSTLIFSFEYEPSFSKP